MNNILYDDNVNTTETISGQYGVRAILTGNEPLSISPTPDFKHLTSLLIIDSSSSLGGYLHNISCGSNTEIEAQQLKIAGIIMIIIQALLRGKGFRISSLLYYSI